MKWRLRAPIHRRMGVLMDADTVACLFAGLIIRIVEIPCPRLSLILNMLIASFVVSLVLNSSWFIRTAEP